MKVLNRLKNAFFKSPFLFVFFSFLVLLFMLGGCSSRSRKSSAGVFERLSPQEREKAQKIIEEFGNCTCGDCDLSLESCDCGAAQAIKEKISQKVKSGEGEEAILKSLKEGKESVPAPLLTTPTFREATQSPGP
jgi:hypothetical protein